jgi:hypothetical protein
MNQLVGRRWSSMRFDLLRHSVPSNIRDSDEFAQWDQVALRLRDSDADASWSPVLRFDLRRRSRRLGASRAAGLSLSLVASRKAKIKANLGRLKRELEAAASEHDGFIVAIAV